MDGETAVLTPRKWNSYKYLPARSMTADFKETAGANDMDQTHQTFRDYFLSPSKPILVPKVMEQRVLHWSHHSIHSQHIFQSPPLCEAPP